MKNYKSKMGIELILPILFLFGYALFESILEQYWIGVFIIFFIISLLFYTFLSINYKINFKHSKI